jgi:hypothetical protein
MGVDIVDVEEGYERLVSDTEIDCDGCRVHTNVVISVIVDEALGQSLAEEGIFSDDGAGQSESCESN